MGEGARRRPVQPRGGGRLSPGGPPGQRLTASQKPLAFLLDFDGLILDTELCAWRSWGEEYRRHGEVLDEATWRQDLGSERNLANRLAELRATVGPEFDAEACRTRRLARHGALVAEQDARAGVRGFIAAAVRGGQQLAVVSSSGDPWVRGHLDRLGLLGCFITLCTGDQVLRTKPAPDLYEMALGRLGLVPSQAVAFEDSERGVQAGACRGHTLCCGSEPGHPRPRLRRRGSGGRLLARPADRRAAQPAPDRLWR